MAIWLQNLTVSTCHVMVLLVDTVESEHPCTMLLYMARAIISGLVRDGDPEIVNVIRWTSEGEYIDFSSCTACTCICILSVT